MKVGDLVQLSPRKTRKGMPYDDKLGLITKVTKPTASSWVPKVVVDFDGSLYTFSLHDLEVVSESR